MLPAAVGRGSRLSETGPEIGGLVGIRGLGVRLNAVAVVTAWALCLAAAVGPAAGATGAGLGVAAQQDPVTSTVAMWRPAAFGLAVGAVSPLTSPLVSSSSGSDYLGSFYSSMSADGHHVAFAAFRMNPTPSDPNNHAMDIWLKDVATHRLQLVSRTSSVGSTPDFLARTSVSRNGQYVAYSRVVGGISQVFVKDMTNGRVTEVSVNNFGEPGDSWSWCPSISDDGQVVAYTSSASNLASPDTNNEEDTFVWDMQLQRTMLVSADSAGVQLGEHGTPLPPSISADGSHVAFPWYRPWGYDVYVKDISTLATAWRGSLVKASVDNPQGGGNYSVYP